MKTKFITLLVGFVLTVAKLTAQTPPPSYYYNLALDCINSTADVDIQWAASQEAAYNQFNGWGTGYGGYGDGASGYYSNYPIFKPDGDGQGGQWSWTYHYAGSQSIYGSSSLQQLESLLGLFGFLPDNLSNHFVALFNSNTQFSHLNPIMVIDIILPQAKQDAIADLNSWYSYAQSSYQTTGTYPPPPL